MREDLLKLHPGEWRGNGGRMEGKLMVLLSGRSLCAGSNESHKS